MNVVSDASTLINLARIGEIDLLRQLYGKLLIPEAVWREVVTEGVGQPGAEEIRTASWIETKEVANKNLVYHGGNPPLVTGWRRTHSPPGILGREPRC